MPRKYTKRNEAYWNHKSKAFQVQNSINNVSFENRSVTDDRPSQVRAENASAISSYSLNAPKNLEPWELYQSVSPVRIAADAIGDTISAGSIRLYHNDREIVGGSLHSLLTRPNGYETQCDLLRASAINFVLYGEIAWHMITAQQETQDSSGKLLYSSDKPEFIYHISSQNLRVGKIRGHHDTQSPVAPPRSLADIMTWRHMRASWYEEIQDLYIAFTKNYNPNNVIRGSSVLDAIQNEANVYYRAGSYTKSFFYNNCSPSHIVVLPEGLPAAKLDSIKEHYEASYLGSQNAFRTHFVTGGKAVDVKKLSETPSEVDYTTLQAFNAEQIMAIIGVTPIVTGYTPRTRFQTADEEIEIFVSKTILPLSSTIARMISHQVANVPEWDWLSDARYEDGSTSSLSSLMQRSRAISAQVHELGSPDDEIVVVVDVDQIPIVRKQKQLALNQVSKMATELHMSISEAADFVGIELPPSPVRDVIWMPSGLRPAEDLLSKPEPEPVSTPEQDSDVQETAQDAPGSTEKEKTTDDTDEKPLSEDEVNAVTHLSKQISRAMFLLRGHVLTQLSGNKRLTIRGMEEVVDQVIPAFVLAPKIREIKAISRGRDDSKIRSFFNAQKPRHYRRLAEQIVRTIHND